MNEYDEKANRFAEKYGVRLEVLDKEYRPYFVDEKDERWVYKCRISRNGKRYTFTFGQSLAAGDKKPRLYDVLCCFEKCDPGTFEDFCGEFGYDEDSRKAEQIYKRVVKEWKAVERLFGDCLEDLRKIW